MGTHVMNFIDYNTRLNVACVADANYGAYAGIALYSVLRANPNNIHLHIFSDGISELDISRIKNMAEVHGARASVYNLSDILDTHSSLKSWGYYSRTAYGRLFMANLLPLNVKEIIYLDCDVICISELQSLWDLRKNISIIGAVRDVWIDPNTSYKLRIGMSPNHIYFNTGVLLINIEEWRKRDLEVALIDNINCNKFYEFSDQDAINILLSTEIFELPRKWNTMVTAPGGEDIDKILEDSSNIHFCSGLKPWHFGYQASGGKGGRMFKQAKAESPWKNKRRIFNFNRVQRKLSQVLHKYYSWR